MAQDKAQRFLDEMFPKLCEFNTSPHNLEKGIFSSVTNKTYPVEVLTFTGMPEVSLTIPCPDLDCSSSRFVGVSSVHLGFRDEVMLIVKARPLTDKMKGHGPQEEIRARKIQSALEYYELVGKPRQEDLKRKWKEKWLDSKQSKPPYKKQYEQLSLALPKP